MSPLTALPRRRALAGDTQTPLHVRLVTDPIPHLYSFASSHWPGLSPGPLFFHSDFSPAPFTTLQPLAYLFSMSFAHI